MKRKTLWRNEKMRKCFYLLIIICFLLCMSIGCSENKIHQRDFHLKGENELKKLSAYDFDSFRFNAGIPRKYDDIPDLPPRPNSENYLITLSDYKTALPSYYMQDIDQDTKCMVYKVETSKGETAYAYVLFDYVNDSDDCKTKDWKKTGEIYYITEIKDSSDFENIAISASSLLDVINITSAAELEFGMPITTSSEIETSIHLLLKDGILRLYFNTPSMYDLDGSDIFSQIIVTKKEFFPFLGPDFPFEISADIFA